MKNGMGRAVLVPDLLAKDGPHIGVAEDFLVLRCSFCRVLTREDVRFRSDAFLCHRCAEPTASP